MPVPRALARALLHVNTAIHLRPRQVVARVRHALRGFEAPPDAESPAFDPACLDRLRAFMERWAEHAPPSPEGIGALLGGHFSFAGETIVSKDAPPWHAEGACRLWRYEIQYCGFLRDLALASLVAPSRKAIRDRARKWRDDWIKANPAKPGPAWDAYPTAARLMNWALAESVFGVETEASRASYAQQARHLAGRLEWHVDGNHLLQNAAGLSVAGALLGNGLEARGLNVLRRAVSEQVLPDGGHAERCPLYHARVLLDLLVVRAACRDTAWLAPTIASMARFLGDTLHPDGDLPQFGDTSLDEYPPPKALLALAEASAASPVPSRFFEDTGFYVLSSRERAAWLIVKASPPGMACQPGHAHADALGYEFSWQGARVVVDTGVHGYDGSPLRDYCRGTSAHNTVQVDGIEQMRYWKTFRVAQRYDTGPCQLEEGDDGMVRFEGRCAVGRVYQQTRSLAVPLEDNGASWLYSVTDEVRGRIGGRCVRSYVHLHPAWRARIEGTAAVVTDGQSSLRFVLLDGDATWSIARGAMPPVWEPRWKGASRTREISDPTLEGWYCATFGKAEPADVLILGVTVPTGASAIELGYRVEAVERE